jgi:ectoine hydroxylase-related dioxygenase (phytanoyl-CoA dioxygenase family)
MTFCVTEEQIHDFHRDGYLFVRNLFDAEEVDILLTTARTESRIINRAHDLKDTSGRSSKLTFWNHPGYDVFGLASRSRRIVDTAEALLDDEVYHYHSKLSIKEPRVGGAWEWHQDYGYWHDFGCLSPNMLSCMTALDPCTRENGCMRVLKGSHKGGLIEHYMEGEQAAADGGRVEELAKDLDLVYCEMNPGDSLFFHANTLHASAPNDSDDPRWVFISCYNARSNNPTNADNHPQYTPLKKVDDNAIHSSVEKL